MIFFKKLIRRFKATPYEYLRRLAKNEFKSHECEKILGDRKLVRDFGRFYEENEEHMRFLSFVFQNRLENSATSFIKFFQQCSMEGENYRIETDKKLHDDKMAEYEEAKKAKDRDRMMQLRNEISKMK